MKKRAPGLFELEKRCASIFEQVITMALQYQVIYQKRRELKKSEGKTEAIIL